MSLIAQQLQASYGGFSPQPGQAGPYSVAPNMPPQNGAGSTVRDNLSALEAELANLSETISMLANRISITSLPMPPDAVNKDSLPQQMQSELAQRVMSAVCQVRGLTKWLTDIRNSIDV